MMHVEQTRQVFVYLVHIEVINDGIEAGVQIVEQGHHLERDRE